ncbi:dihydrolipoyl dehydrogenase [Acinetobacter rongchengensis]|uniref:Dihydrolipoyl dehydrogenase n=1 Tax=Acinetobacter rongchengensis TaxID=2419601 RepID=A0A3A8F6S3_9GAMM|nr:dihydrolipoyl dehydrogenase [Acinetobacter rongchengensis]RKG36443.1 dihydrolipoyl dehydrogenase [Acinetobacter rongchengensis]
MYDIIIIGAGTAGISAYKEAIKYTSNILIINDGPWDTTCARVGCMPSKVLISTANRMYDIEHANEVGLNIKSELDTSHVMQHVRELRDRFTRATLKDVDSWNPKHKINGRAKFINKHTIEVNGQLYSSKSFIIAVGSTPNYEAVWKEKLGNKLITSDEIFELETLPKSIAVIGSGVIAIELAQAMQRLGVETTVFARSKKVGVLSSPRLQQIAQVELSKDLNIKFEILPTSVESTQNSIKLNFIENAESKHIYVDYVLAATGRQSHLKTLNLENINSSFSDLKKLPLDNETKQLLDLPIFIIGDAFTQTPLQHEAANEGKLVISSCLNFPKVSNLKQLTPLGIVFSNPEMAIIGSNYSNLSKLGIEFITGYASYEKQGRALVLGKNKGAIEVYIDKNSRKLLGAELFVESAEHMAHLLAWMIAENVTIDDILQKPFYHPTLEEGLRTAFKHARRQL